MSNEEFVENIKSEDLGINISNRFQSAYSTLSFILIGSFAFLLFLY